MSRSLPLLVLLGALGACAISAATASELAPSVSDTPKDQGSTLPVESPTRRPSPRAGGGGDAKSGESTKVIKEKDKAKAAQSGNDATLRDLPSPAQKGSE